jgi:SAM-dependent methyltransferase
MDKAYYSDYFHLERNHWWFLARRKILHDYVDSLAKGKRLRILNVGAATGASSEMLAEFGEVTSIEYDKDCCEFVQRNLNREFICASITDLPFEDHSFDLVCAFDVVEHVGDHEKAIDEMFRVCNIDGDVLCTVPAYMFLWSHHDVVNQHCRRYTKKNFRSLFSKKGKIQFTSYFNTILFIPIALFRFFDRLFKPKFVRKDAGSDFSVTKNKMLDSIFYRIMLADNFFIRARIALPFGVSVLLSSKNSK